MPPTISLFNTLTQRIEPLQPRPGGVTLYVCGVTPYDTTHLGHAFVFVTFDVLARFLETIGHSVSYVQNVTDIDDDILRRSRELGLEYDVLGRRETRRYREDMAALRVRPPGRLVLATEVMPQIVRSVERLVEMGLAYVVEGDVFFSNRAFPGYGEIAHVSRERMIRLATQHGGFPDDRRKRDPLDFSLWQAQKPGEPAWPSRFGPGRPGWHIECSTMAAELLGFPVDIHGGGADLIFPHHASEIAQAESLAASRPFVRHWMHIAMVRMEGEKMSKSLGNMVFVRDLVQHYPVDAIRLYLLSHHYRQEFEWSEDSLKDMVELSARLRTLAGRTPEGTPAAPAGHSEAALSSLADDFQTPRVVGRLRNLVDRADETPPSPEELGEICWVTRVLGLELRNTLVPSGAAHL